MNSLFKSILLAGLPECCESKNKNKIRSIETNNFLKKFDKKGNLIDFKIKKKRSIKNVLTKYSKQQKFYDKNKNLIKHFIFKNKTEKTPFVKVYFEYDSNNLLIRKLCYRNQELLYVKKYKYENNNNYISVVKLIPVNILSGFCEKFKVISEFSVLQTFENKEKIIEIYYKDYEKTEDFNNFVFYYKRRRIFNDLIISEYQKYNIDVINGDFINAEDLLNFDYIFDKYGNWKEYSVLVKNACVFKSKRKIFYY